MGTRWPRMRIGGDGEVRDSYGVIGDVDFDPHTIVFTMFTSSLKYNVTIIQASGTVKAENKPMITDNLLSFSNPAHPMVSCVRTTWAVFGGTYVIGSVDISRKKP